MAFRSVALKPPCPKNTKPRTHAIRGSELEHFGQFHADKPDRIHYIVTTPEGIVVKTPSNGDIVLNVAMSGGGVDWLGLLALAIIIGAAWVIASRKR